MHRIHNNRKIKDEIPAIALLFGCYLSFVVVTVYADQIGFLIAFCALVPVLVLHSSLQHEFIHGHPTSKQSFNDFLVSVPIGMLIPYLRFKDTHLAHHFDPNLTDPYDDPESNFLDPKVWKKLPKWKKAVYNANNTLFGRMLVGPLIGLLAFYREDLAAITKLNFRIIISYVHHMAGLVVVLLLLSEYATLPFWLLLLAGYAAISILKIRTFIEHKAHQRVAARTVIIEDKGPLALLFLNNNFHAIHHLYPKLVWHRLPAKFYAQKDNYLARNGGYWFSSYWPVFRSYFFNRKDPVPHPLMDGFELEHTDSDTTHPSRDLVKVHH